MNHVCSDRADPGRFGLATRAGTCKHTITFSDIPHPDGTTPLDLVTCFAVDYDSTVEISAEDVPLDARAEELRPDINITDGESGRINFGDIRFGFRRWAFCNGAGVEFRLRVEVRVHCTDPVSDPLNLEPGTDERRICCLTFVRPHGDLSVYTTCSLDPTIDGSISDNDQQPIPTDGTDGTTGTDGTNGGTEGTDGTNGGTEGTDGTNGVTDGTNGGTDGTNGVTDGTNGGTDGTNDGTDGTNDESVTESAAVVFTVGLVSLTAFLI